MLLRSSRGRDTTATCHRRPRPWLTGGPPGAPSARPHRTHSLSPPAPGPLANHTPCASPAHLRSAPPAAGHGHRGVNRSAPLPPRGCRGTPRERSCGGDAQNVFHFPKQTRRRREGGVRAPSGRSGCLSNSNPAVITGHPHARHLLYSPPPPQLLPAATGGGR